MQQFIPALNPVPPFQLGEPHITADIIDTKKFGADKDYCRLHPAEDDRGSDFGSDLSSVADKNWTTTMFSHHAEEAEFCQQQLISVNMFSYFWHVSTMEELVEQILSSLNFLEAYSIGNSQQFERQQSNP